MSYVLNNKKFFYTWYDKNRNPHPSLAKGKFVISVDNSKFKKGGKNFTDFKDVESIKKFLTEIPKEKRNFYEYRKEKQPFKIFFDIDFEKTPSQPDFPKDLLINFLRELKFNFCLLFNKTLSDEEIFVYQSCTEKKLSYHIILPYYHTSLLQLMIALRDRIYKTLSDVYKYSYNFVLPSSCIDKSIYNKSGHFRCIYCCKEGKQNYKLPLSENPKAKTLKHSLITNISPKSVELLTYDNTVFEEEEIERKVEEVQFSGDANVSNNIIKFILDNLSETRSSDYESWIKIGFILFNSNIDFEWFDYFSQKSEDKYNEKAVSDFWNTLKQSERDKKLNYASLLFYLRQDNPSAFLTLKNVCNPISNIESSFQNFFMLDNLQTTQTLDISIFEERYLECSRFEGYEDILVQSYLDTGKTECLSKLEQIRNKSFKILILTNRRKLAKEFSKRFAAHIYDIQCYLDYDKRKHGSDFFNRVIIQPESLWMIPQDIVYDLLIIDECESVFSQFTSTTMKTSQAEKDNVLPTITGELFFDRHSEFAYRWDLLTKKSKKIIFCDAFLSKRTIDMYKDLGRKGRLLINKYRPQQRKAINIPIDKIKGTKRESIKPLIDKAIDELKKDKNIFIVVSSLTKMNDFLEAFKPFNKFIGKAYSSALNAGKLLKFNCEEEWKSCNYVIITTTITTGINFNLDHFDSVFVYFQSTPLVRDLFQSIMRVRRLRENTLYYTVSDHVFGDTFNSYPSVEEIKNEIKSKSSFIKENFSMVRVCSIDSLVTIAAYNKFERNCQSYLFTYRNIIGIFFNMCNYKIIGDDLLSENVDDDFDHGNNDDLLEIYDEAFDRVINSIPEEIASIKKHIDEGVDTPLEREILSLNYFIEKFNIDKSNPELKYHLRGVYLSFRKNPDIKAQASRNSSFLNGSWFDPTIHSTIESTNPKISELCKYYVMHKICEEMKISYSPVEAEIISRETVQHLSPQLLNKWAIHYFNMKDKKKVDGKMVPVNPSSITPSDNIRYINHIFSTFGGCKFCPEGKKKVRKINGKNVDVTPYTLDFPNFMVSLCLLQKNKNRNSSIGEHLKIFFENTINS